MTENVNIPGSVFIISAPSGTGKTSLVNALLDSDPQLGVSVSHTTRAPRPGEVDGRDYHFVDRAGFHALVDEGAFIEWAGVFGNFYGTSAHAVQDELRQGRDVILEIDWQGARQVRVHMPEAISIFILPPSRESLRERLAGRGQDSPDTIAQRMAAARNEASHWAEYDYLLVNDEFGAALADLQAVVRARRLRRVVQGERHRPLLESLLLEGVSAVN